MSEYSDHELPEDLLELEQQLQELVPGPISVELFSRLEVSMTDAGDHSSGTSESQESFDELEVHLGQMAPATMPTDMLDRMARAMDRWHEQMPVEEKLVPFGDSEGKKKPIRNKHTSGMLAAAAAVAILGAVTALIVPDFLKAPSSGQAQASNTSNALVAAAIDSTVAAVHPMASSMEPHTRRLMPDSLSHKVTNTSDQGVVLAGNRIPHRCLRVDYIDRVKVRDADGREIEIKRPGVRYVLLPVETN